MHGRIRSPWPQHTTVVAGFLLLASGLAQLAVSAGLQVPVTEMFVVPLSGLPVSFGEAVARAAGFVVLALGATGEIGVVARSLLGRAALLLWGAEPLVLLVLSLTLVPNAQEAPVTGYLLVGLQLVFTLAKLSAAVLVIHTRVLDGAARWVFLLIAVIDCTFIALSNPPPFAAYAALAVLQALAATPLEYLQPALTLLLATTLLLWSRTEAVKHRAQTIYDAW